MLRRDAEVKLFYNATHITFTIRNPATNKSVVEEISDIKYDEAQSDRS